MTRVAANTHAVDLNRGGLMCSTRYVDVVPYDGPYVTCVRCWHALHRLGVVSGSQARRAWPKVRLITGLRMVRDVK